MAYNDLCPSDIWLHLFLCCTTRYFLLVFVTISFAVSGVSVSSSSSLLIFYLIVMHSSPPTSFTTSCVHACIHHVGEKIERRKEIDLRSNELLLTGEGLPPSFCPARASFSSRNGSEGLQLNLVKSCGGRSMPEIHVYCFKILSKTFFYTILRNMTSDHNDDTEIDCLAEKYIACTKEKLICTR